MLPKKLVSMIFLFVLVCPAASFADESGGGGKEDHFLVFDENTPKFDELPFDIDESKRLKPKANDFELVRFAPMSNKLGERWALITVRNTSSARRSLKGEYIVATFGNGEQANPTRLNERVDAGEVFTKTVSFGVNKFPIIMLEIQP